MQLVALTKKKNESILKRMTFFFSKRGSSVKPEANKMATCGGGKWAGIRTGLFRARAWISMAGSKATHREYC